MVVNQQLSICIVRMGRCHVIGPSLKTELTVYTKGAWKFFTYDHRRSTPGLPVRSAILKSATGGLVVKWVTIGEYPLLYVFFVFMDYVWFACLSNCRLCGIFRDMVRSAVLRWGIRGIVLGIGRIGLRALAPELGYRVGHVESGGCKGESGDFESDYGGDYYE
ncbi:hypothetical protein FB567DRAFT_126761 [Paraphoma chrysanthemicola]|uniref:Uncharacterized protein n=1 Tax=Paraphoma chrysanthemicola TaxID=798071 RepID=A0A8K0VUZ9_9PLEO|nr:hypothetical protein FB567DRAFT_126761 [Paraphoma chrysanthemicola]